jgi:hypothetical protein
MDSRWGSLAAAVALAAPSPVAAQRIAELGVQATVLIANPGSMVAGVSGALRTSSRTRVSVGAGVGGALGETVVRGELLAHFLLNPTRRQGVAPYVAGGVAVESGPVAEGYLVLTLGLESRPGAKSGWFVETGVGGGARIAVGFRHRHLPPGWPD